MLSRQKIEIINDVYDHVHSALWAALIAALAWFAVVVAPNIPNARVQWEIKRIQQIAAEHEAYCSKWGMGLGTPANHQCILDLQAYRARIEDRFALDNDGL